MPHNGEMIDFTTTVTLKPKCPHHTGWFKQVQFKFLGFRIIKKFFLCTECEDLIPLDEWKSTKEESVTFKLTNT